MSRRVNVRLLLIAVAFVAVSGWLAFDSGSTRPASEVIGWISLVFFGACLIAILWMLVSPPRLALSATGFRLAGNLWHRPTERVWIECGEFRARRIGAGLGRPNLVVYRTTRTDKRPLRSVNRAIVGGDESLVAGFDGLSAGELAELLNRYRSAAVSSIRSPD